MPEQIDRIKKLQNQIGAVEPQTNVQAPQSTVESLSGIMQAVSPSAFSPTRGFSPAEMKNIEKRIDAGLQDPKLKRALIEGGLGGLFAAPVPGARPLAMFIRMMLAGTGESVGSFISERFDPSSDPDQRAFKAFGRGFTTQAAGETIFGIGRSIFSRSDLEKGAEELVSTVSARGGVVTPGTISRSRTVDLLEGIAEASFLGGGTLKKTKRQAVDIVDAAIEEFVAKFTSKGGRLDVAELIQDTLANGIEAFKVQARSMYKTIDSLSPDVAVDIGKGTAVRKMAESVLKQSEEGLGSPAMAKIAKKILNNPETISFAEAQTLRSDLLSVIRQTGELVPGKAPAAAKRLIPVIDQAMNRAAIDLPRSVLRDWRNANNFWRRGSKVFNDRMVKAIARADPQAVFEQAVRAGRPNTIARVRDLIVTGGKRFRPKTKSGKDRSVIAAVPKSKEWTAVQGQFLQDLLLKSSTLEGGALSGKALRTNLKRFGDESLNQVFPVGNGADHIKSLARQLELVQGELGETTGRVFIQLKQAGMAGEVAGVVFGMTGSINPALAAGIFLAPATIAKLFTRADFTRAITFGMKNAPGTEASFNAGLQILTALAAEGALPRDPLTLPQEGEDYFPPSAQ